VPVESHGPATALALHAVLEMREGSTRMPLEGEVQIPVVDVRTPVFDATACPSAPDVRRRVGSISALKVFGRFGPNHETGTSGP
jgi:hypothetical protein